MHEISHLVIVSMQMRSVFGTEWRLFTEQELCATTELWVILVGVPQKETFCSFYTKKSSFSVQRAFLEQVYLSDLSVMASTVTIYRYHRFCL